MEGCLLHHIAKMIQTLISTRKISKLKYLRAGLGLNTQLNQNRGKNKLSAKLRNIYPNLKVPMEILSFNVNSRLIKTQISQLNHQISEEILQINFPKCKSWCKNQLTGFANSFDPNKNLLYKECAACKDELYKNQKCNGDIWNQAGWILQNNNEKEGENYQKLVEKYRKSMVNALTNPKVDQEQYIEFQSYLIHYYQYFDQYNVNQRSQICEQFLQYLNLLENKEELSQKYNTNFKNNSLMIQPNKTFVVNLPAPPQFQISIPKFLWGEIQKYGLQGYIIYRMIENQELNLNYQVIDKIFLSKVREQQQRYPGNVGRKK